MSQPSSNQILALALLLTSLSSLILSATEADQTIDAIDPKKCGRGFWPDSKADRHSLARAHHKRHNPSRYGEDDLDHPWYVALGARRSRSDHDCGGVIIHKDLIVTTATCVNDLHKNGRDPWVYGGLKGEGEFKQKRLVKKFCVVPDSFREHGRILDIAVARLETGFHYNDFIQPACLDRSVFTNSSTRYVDCRMASLPLESDMSKRITPRDLSMKECDAIHNIASDQLCFANEEGSRALCSADMGGPLMCRKNRGIQFFVVGVGSHFIDANKCGENATSRVAVSWFKRQAKALTELVEQCLE